METSLVARIQTNTVIDTGHFSLKYGPTHLQTYLWEEGVSAHAQTRANFANNRLLLLIDDMDGISSSEERDAYMSQRMPLAYSQILAKHKIPQTEVHILLQYRLKEKGRQLIRKRMSRSALPQCGLIVAANLRWQERQGYSSSIGLYDAAKTTDGLDMMTGMRIAQDIFGVTMQTTYKIYRDFGRYTVLESSMLKPSATPPQS